MKNKIVDVFKIANKVVSITVSNPDFSNLKIGNTVYIGEKMYVVKGVPMSNSSGNLISEDTFTIDYTDDNLLGKQVQFV